MRASPKKNGRALAASCVTCAQTLARPCIMGWVVFDRSLGIDPGTVQRERSNCLVFFFGLGFV